MRIRLKHRSKAYTYMEQKIMEVLLKPRKIDVLY